MDNDRRSVLRGLAAASLALTYGPFARASMPGTPSPIRDAVADLRQLPITPVVANGALDRHFLHGVRMAANQHGVAQDTPFRIAGFDVGAYFRLHALLNEQRPRMLVGLTDDATATLLLDLARSANGRVIALQHFRAGTNDAATQWATALGYALGSRQSTPLLPPTAPAAGSDHAYVSFCCAL
jgi:hypothetical protein